MTEPSEKETPKGLIAWFIDNHVAANILMLLFVIGGVVSVKNMRTETFPSIDPRLVTVSVSYPGATPSEVADSITNRIEEDLTGIEGVKRVSSTASEGRGLVSVELLDFADADEVYNDVETAVNSLNDFPPQNAERPIITKVRVTPEVMTLALHGDVDELTLKYWAETIEDEIKILKGVSFTSVSGVRDYQISIEIKEAALQKYKLSLMDVRNAVQRFSEDVPAGMVESKQGDVLLRVQEKKNTGKEYEKIVLRTLPDGSSLTVGDVGKVIDELEDINIVSKFNNERAAFIDIKRNDTDDTLKVANTIKKYLQTVKLPEGIKLSLANDRTVILKDRISLMVRNALLGFVLVFLILLLFLDLKLAFWTSAAIPISFLGGLMIMTALGYSLNMITLFALIVVLGIVVDDGIVVGESIFNAQEEGKDNGNTVLKGMKAVIAPVTIGVLTTMAAFAPLIFSTGTFGQIIGFIPVVVIAILFVSMIEAYFILPSHLSHAGRWSRGFMADVRDKVTDKLNVFIDRWFMPVATVALRWRYAMIAGFIAIAVMTASLVTSGVMRFVFFPDVEGDRLFVTVNMPLGTPFDVTKKTMLTVEGYINQVRKDIDKGKSMSAFESISVTIGEVSAQSGGPKGSMSAQAANHIGQVRVQLVPTDFREYSASQIEDKIRAYIDDIPGIETLAYQSSMLGEEADVEVELSHANEDLLIESSERLKQSLKSIQGTKEVTDSFEEGKEEYVFKLNAQGLAVGLTPSELGQQLRSAFYGVEAQRFQRGASEVVVYVRYPKEERESLGMLKNVRIRLANGKEVPLKAVADIKTQRGYAQILTVDGRRIVNVSGDVNSEVVTAEEVIAKLQKEILPELQSRYPGLSYSFEGESRDRKEDLQSLAKNMLIALLLIYILLGAQLRSYVQPFIIMSAIPFGVVGAILGHLVLGYDLTFISLFGIVALSGVVVNDSVVLVDYLNHHLRSGKTIGESALIAVRRRFRPILLTTLSTSLGLLPILLETSRQAQFLIPMVISLATGIVFSTIVILFLVPCLILIVEDVKGLLRRLGRRVMGK